MDLQYVYLIQEREFVRSKEPVFKIGRTKQPNVERVTQYPKDSQFICQICCDDCAICEKNIIQLFKTKYIHRTDIGNEYFEGDYRYMTDDIANIVKLNRNNLKVIEPAGVIIDTDNKYYCGNCQIVMSSEKKFDAHLLSNKHLNNCSNENCKYKCKNCEKKYQSRGGLFIHRKNCNTFPV
jgi:hypothetical protein